MLQLEIPLLIGTIDLFASRLAQAAERGEIKLKMSARQTAMSMLAFIDGMLWLALATDRPLGALRPELTAGLNCFVQEPDHDASAPCELPASG